MTDTDRISRRRAERDPAAGSAPPNLLSCGFAF